MQNEAKIKELFGNEEFVKKIEGLESPAEMSAVFKEYGVEMSEDDMAEFMKAAMKKESGEELGEEALEDVNGGLIGLLNWTWNRAVNYWGGEKQAVQATVNFWYNTFTGRR